MGMMPIETTLRQWQWEMLTAEQAVGQMLQHIAQLYSELHQLQTAHHHLHLEVKRLREGGRQG